MENEPENEKFNQNDTLRGGIKAFHHEEIVTFGDDEEHFVFEGDFGNGYNRKIKITRQVPGNRNKQYNLFYRFKTLAESGTVDYHVEMSICDRNYSDDSENEVVQSYDPNNKVVYPKSILADDIIKMPKRITYRVNFENVEMVLQPLVRWQMKLQSY